MYAIRSYYDYDNLQLPLTRLLELLEQAESELTDIEQITVPARIVHLV